ncbi:hypothetical protein J6590_058357 [Homalodisca vitripennis]|nr:hypothetical protein J6590_058357 [Homalodisca vitripennis]
MFHCEKSAVSSEVIIQRIVGASSTFTLRHRHRGYCALLTVCGTTSASDHLIWAVSSGRRLRRRDEIILWKDRQHLMREVFSMEMMKYSPKVELEIACGNAGADRVGGCGVVSGKDLLGLVKSCGLQIEKKEADFIGMDVNTRYIEGLSVSTKSELGCELNVLKKL